MRERIWSSLGLLASTSTVTYEQAVYGSFAFRDQGYAMLAQSPGCRPEWLAEFRAACQQIGERPASAVEAPGLFVLRLASGPWAIIGMSPRGRDDRGRPGAMAFHALFLSPGAYRRTGHDPFALAGSLRSDWTAADTALPTGVWTRSAPTTRGPGDPRAAAVAEALTRGRRVVVVSPSPIDGLAREVWSRLAPRVRKRSTLATWAFANGPRFDLLAVPRLAGVALDASYLEPIAPDIEKVATAMSETNPYEAPRVGPSPPPPSARPITAKVQEIARRMLRVRAGGGYRLSTFYALSAKRYVVLLVYFAVILGILGMAQAWVLFALMAGMLAGVLLRDLGWARAGATTWPFTERVTNWAEVERIARTELGD